MKTLFLTATLVVFGCTAALAQSAAIPTGLKQTVKYFPRTQLQLQRTGPISVELNDSVRSCYETVARLARLNVMFGFDLVNPTISFKVEDVDPLETLDRLSIQTHNFIEVLDRKTIIVAADNPTTRRVYQTSVLETVLLINATEQSDVTAIITALRKQLNLSYIAQGTDPKAILMRDTPEKTAAAARIIAEMDRPKSGAASETATRDTRAVAFDVMGNLLVPEGDGVRTSRPGRSPIQVKSTGLRTFNLTDSSRATYELLATMAGLNLIFDQDFRSTGPLSFRVEDMDILDALDYLSLETRNLWMALNDNTILVLPDNQTARRNYENLSVETMYLPPATTSVKMSETITAMRTLLNASFIAQNTKAKPIVVRDTPLKAALAEKIARDMNPTGSATEPLRTSTIATGSVNSPGLGAIGRKLAPTASQLDLKVTRPISINADLGVRAAYSTLAAMAGLSLTFDDALTDTKPQPLRLDNVNILDALDLLGVETRTFWQVVDSKTIVVAPDNQTNRRKLERQVEKTIAVDGDSLQVAEVVTALRTLLNLSQVEARNETIVIRDVPARVAIAEKVIADLKKPAN